MLSLLTLVVFGFLKLALPLTDNGLLAGDQLHMVLCLGRITTKHFTQGQTTLVSFPEEGRSTSHRKLTQFGMDSHVSLLYHILQDMHQDMLWQITTSSLGNMSLVITHEDYWKMDNYVIFTWSGEKDSATDNLNYQVEELKRRISWNNRAKFLVVVAENLRDEAYQVAFKIMKELWEVYRVLNVVVLIPQTRHMALVTAIHDHNTMASTFDLYTWFPYQSEVKCANIDHAVLIDRWVGEDEGHFLRNVDLFPTKIHKNFHGCPLRVSPINAPPLFMRNNYTDDENTTKYEYYGLEAECFKLITETLNITPIYILHSAFGLEVRVNILGDLLNDDTDVTFGAFPLHELVYPSADPTISYIVSYMKWYVPCGRPVPRMEKISKIFNASVWLMLALIFFFSVVVIWLGARSAENYGLKESPSYMTICNSVQNMWAIFIGLAASDMPRTTKLRSYFCLFVWYCFIVSTLFQTYLTSFLVDPGVQERIKTLDELFQSDIIYLYQLDNDDYLKFSFPDYYSKINMQRESCEITNHCIYEFLRTQTFTVIGHSFSVDYMVSVINNPEICTLDDAIYQLNFAMHFIKGNHLVDIFNGIIHGILQGGLIGKWRNDLMTNYKFRCVANNSDIFPNFADFNHDGGDYFVFSLSHLQLAFYAIGVGCSVGFAVLVGEIVHYKLFKKKFRVCNHKLQIRQRGRF
jgi:Ligand-gated ion channel.